MSIKHYEVGPLLSGAAARGNGGRFQVLLKIDKDALTPSRERRGFLYKSP